MVVVSNSQVAEQCFSEIREIILNNWKPLISLRVSADTFCFCLCPDENTRGGLMDYQRICQISASLLFLSP